jgi:DNA-binding response OmpR family regulator
MYKLLIVDDEPDIVNLLKDFFEMHGYSVMTAKNGREALDKSLQKPDLILLDVNLPDVDGFSVCARIRNLVVCPILFLTAKITENDLLNGFHVGGDDYIVKPFSLQTLLARVEAHLRREERRGAPSEARFAGDLVIDYSLRCVRCGDQTLALARKEFDIVELLSMNRGQIFDKERIYERLWGYDSPGDSSVVAEHIRRIRAKLAAVSDASYIETVWGVGYKWVG